MFDRVRLLRERGKGQHSDGGFVDSITKSMKKR